MDPSNVTTPQSLLYPPTVLAKIPAPAKWDVRPLPHLLKGEHADRAGELERLERWYRELESGEKEELLKRLRETDRRVFWSAVAELLTARFCLERCWSARHAFDFKRKRPDFLVEAPRSTRFLLEVVTAFQAEGRDAEMEVLYEVATILDKISHRRGVVLQAGDSPVRRADVETLLPHIQAWLDSLDNGGQSVLEVGPPTVLCSLRLTAGGPRPTEAPVVEGVMGRGGPIDATDRLHSALRRKITKYREAKGAGLPLVVFVWTVDWNVTREALEWALFGRPVVHFSLSRDKPDPSVSRAPGGLFTPGPTSPPRNTTLAAVGFCERVWEDGKVFAQVRLYHHPYAKNPICPAVFKGIPQFLPERITPEGFTCRWDRRPRGRGVRLR